MVNSTKAKISLAVITASTWVFWIVLSLLNDRRNLYSNYNSFNEKINPPELNVNSPQTLMGKVALLEQLLEIGDIDALKELLISLINQNQETWELSLMLVEIERKKGNLAEAQKEINRIRKKYPENLHLINIKVLLDLEQVRNRDAISFLRSQFESTKTTSSRISIGLLLANTLSKSGRTSSAEDLYYLLSKENPKDPKALLALAELKNEQGQYIKALKILKELRSKRTKTGSQDLLIDELVEEWGRKAALRKAF